MIATRGNRVSSRMSKIFEGLNSRNPSGVYIRSKRNTSMSDIAEAQWKSMNGAAILIDDDGDILAGGPKEFQTKASKAEIKAAVKDANARSEAENERRKKANEGRRRITISVYDDEVDGVYYPNRRKL